MTTASPDTIIDSPQALRSALNILMKARHESYMAHSRAVCRQDYATPDRIAELGEIAKLAANAERRLLAFCNHLGRTNPKHPECDLCRRFSITGGPDHEASCSCRSGRHAHCTCDACF